jgi:AhpC/TSA family
MSRPEGSAGPPASPAAPAAPRYGRYVGLLAVVILVLITINTIVTKPHGGSGFAPGEKLAPFAVPLALGSLRGDANVATHADQGSAGRVPACQVRGAQILNLCQLYEGAPVVLALFVDSGSCPAVLGDMRTLAPSFPGVRFAAVAIKGQRAAVRRLVRARGLQFPVGIDSDGALAVLYKVASCPQLSFALPGGVEQGRTVLAHVPIATLRARIAQLVAAARARGWHGA